MDAVSPGNPEPHKPDSALVTILLAEIRHYATAIGQALKELGLAVQLIVALSLLAIVALLLTRVSDFTFTVYALTFLVLNVYVLLEIKTTPAKKHLAAIDGAIAELNQTSATILTGYSNRFLQKHHGTESEIQRDLVASHAVVIAKLRDTLGKPGPWLWAVVQNAIVIFFVVCLFITGFFLYMYAKSNASKLGIIRVEYDEPIIATGPTATVTSLFPKGEAPGTEKPRDQAFYQQSLAFDWMGTAIGPSGPNVPLRVAVLESDRQFDKYYSELTAHVQAADPALFKVSSGIAYLYRDRANPSTYRQVPFGVSKDKETNCLFATPDNGESLLLILRVIETQPNARGAYGREPSEYGLKIVVDNQKTRASKGSQKGDAQ
jgi:hypothetical protein